MCVPQCCYFRIYYRTRLIINASYQLSHVEMFGKGQREIFLFSLKCKY